MKLVPNTIARSVSRQVLSGQRHAPAILFGVGVVGMVGSTVLACRATLRLEEVTLKARSDLRKARELDSPEYTNRDRKQDTAIIYTRSVVGVARLYAPAVLLGAASVACLTKSHNILAGRNAALTAAYAAVDEAFKTYRSRVVERYGPDVDREMRYETEEVTIIDDETGKTVSKVRVGPNECSMYARFFDQYSGGWSKNPEHNLIFLKGQQNYANDLLVTKGHVFLNEVYRMLGLPHTRAGSVVGWIISDDSDNYIDFGIFDHNNGAIDFINGRESAVLLDFNVDGVIWDKIDKYDRGPVQWQQ